MEAVLVVVRKAFNSGKDSMAFKPNYGMQRADRNRSAQARREQKQRKREEKSAQRKAESAVETKTSPATAKT